MQLYDKMVAFIFDDLITLYILCYTYELEPVCFRGCRASRFCRSVLFSLQRAPSSIEVHILLTNSTENTFSNVYKTACVTLYKADYAFVSASWFFGPAFSIIEKLWINFHKFLEEIELCPETVE